MKLKYDGYYLERERILVLINLQEKFINNMKKDILMYKDDPMTIRYINLLV